MGMENNASSSPHLEERGRKSSKPMMEKRRRARINQSLTELKTLILEAMKKDTSCYSKLEKADILEMTVRYLRTLKTQKFPATITSDPSAIAQYRAGFNECASEVTRYFMANEACDAQVKTRILSHLANACQPRPTISTQPPNPRTPPVPMLHPTFPLAFAQQNILPASSSTYMKPCTDPSPPSLLTVPPQFQIVPGQLANGKLAAVLVPSQANAMASFPQLVPVFNRPTPDFQPLQGFQFNTVDNSPNTRHDSDTVWRPW